ncbi:hypothetical protein F5Y13DRAFT_203105 [Hypoxylon sp. FL1857]|nr:hypothetical protein F5Y13DRAFT_203105 [Hypoxylon sp. FL1857]
MKLISWWASFQLFAAPAFSQAHFREWFPQYRFNFTSIMRDNCSSIYDNYVTGTRNGTTGKSATSRPVVACILAAIDEAGKANLATAGVVLGLLPTMLSITSSMTNEVGLVALRRPVLGLLLAAGAPSANALRTFQQPEPAQLLLEPSPFRTLYPSHLSPSMQIVVSAVQYLAGLGAVANLAEVSYEVCLRTNVSWATETAYLPALWAFLTVIIHFLGTIAVHLRIKFINHRVSDSAWGECVKLCPHWLKQEVVPIISQRIDRAETRRATWWFLITSWGASIATFWQIIFGTCIFSGILFISTQDAYLVFARYWISTLCCRLIVMFEFNGMKVSLAMNEGNTNRIRLERRH